MSKPAKKRSAISCEDGYDCAMARLSFIQLQGGKRSLIFVNSRHASEIPGFIVHAGKAVKEIEWLIGALKKRFQKEAEAEGVK